MTHTLTTTLIGSLLVSVLATACEGGSNSTGDTGDSTDTGDTADGADTGDTTDPGTPTDTGDTDDTGVTGDTGEEESIVALLAEIPEGTPWSGLSDAQRERFEAFASQSLKEYGERWSGAQLKAHEATLLAAPTPAMIAAFDAYVKSAFATQLNDPAFTPSTDLDAGLREALTRLYLLRVAAWRINARSYGKFTEFDWDGETRIDEFPLPDEGAAAAYRAYAEETIAALDAVDLAGLTPEQAAVHELARFHALQHAYQSAGFNYGGRDFFTLPSRSAWAFDLLLLRGDVGGEVLQDDEDYLRTINAYLLAPLENVDRGSVTANPFFFSFVQDPANVEEYLGAGTPAAKGFALLAAWFVERLGASGQAQAKCTVYSDAQRDFMWRAIAADNLFHPETYGSLADFRDVFDEIAGGTFAVYKAALSEAVETSGLLTPEQAAQVLLKIDEETRFGALLETAKLAMDEATGASEASAAFQAQLDQVPKIGGYDSPDMPIRPEDQAAVDAAWEDVREFLSVEYGFDLAKLDDHVEVTTAASASTAKPGEIEFGALRARTLTSVYSVLLHEAHHSYNFATGVAASGAVWEGAAKSVETSVLPKFLTWVLAKQNTPELAPFYTIVGYTGDVNGFFAKTEATFGVLFRASCGEGEPDSFEYAKTFAEQRGITDPGTQHDYAVRANHGIAYLQYSIGEIQYQTVLDYFSGALGAPVDAFHLQACEMAFTDLSEDAVAQLKACPNAP